MGVVTESWAVDTLLFTATLLFLLFWYYRSTTSYFKDRGIPYLRPYPLVGQIELFTKSQHDFSKCLYNSFPDERFFGYFQTRVPTLVVRDLDLIHRIMVKDFAHFHDRGFPSVESDPLSKNLFNLKGNAWRIMRHKLIPTFTTGKLKQMFDQLNKSGDNLMEDVQKTSVSGEAVDARLFVTNFTTEVIGSTAFGLDFSKNNPQAIEFKKMITALFALTFRQMLVFFFTLFSPKLVSRLKVSTFKREACDYFFRLTKATKDYRIQNNIKRNDYFQLLLSLQEAEKSGKGLAPTATATDNNEEDALINQMDYVPQFSQEETGFNLFSDESLTAQSMVFLTAGTDSIASTLSFALYHIAKNPELQKIVREEVEMAVIKHGGWSYQALKDMTFVDQVIQEAQRMYPIVPLLMRECTVPYHIPESNIVLEKGTIITIPVGGLQMDPKYYTSPEIFNPERFGDNNHKPNPTFMPFGDGPRICIAMRFAILEMKVCLAKILAEYSVEVNSKTIEPFKFDRKSFFPRPVGGIIINFKKQPLKSSVKTT